MKSAFRVAMTELVGAPGPHRGQHRSARHRRQGFAFLGPQVQNNLEREFLASYQAQGSAQPADRHVLRPPTEKANLLVLELQPEGQAPGLPHI